MQPDPKQIYSWTEYLSWSAGPRRSRWELIGGRPYPMRRPTPQHQALCQEFYFHLLRLLEGNGCRPLRAPLDVKLSDQDVVQPDLLVICCPKSIRSIYVDGPPDLIVEIATPETFRHNRQLKLNLYARAGVREYWMVTPHPFLVEVLSNVNGTYAITGSYSEQDVLRSPAFADWELPLEEIYTSLQADPVRHRAR